MYWLTYLNFLNVWNFQIIFIKWILGWKNCIIWYMTSVSIFCLTILIIIGIILSRIRLNWGFISKMHVFIYWRVWIFICIETGCLRLHCRILSFSKTYSLLYRGRRYWSLILISFFLIYRTQSFFCKIGSINRWGMNFKGADRRSMLTKCINSYLKSGFFDRFVSNSRIRYAIRQILIIFL